MTNRAITPRPFLAQFEIEISQPESNIKDGCRESLNPSGDNGPKTKIKSVVFASKVTLVKEETTDDE